MILIDVGAYLSPYHEAATVIGMKIGICPHRAGPIRQIPATGFMEEMDSCLELWAQPWRNCVQGEGEHAQFDDMARSTGSVLWTPITIEFGSTSRCHLQP